MSSAIAKGLNRTLAAPLVSGSIEMDGNFVETRKRL